MQNDLGYVKLREENFGGRVEVCETQWLDRLSFPVKIPHCLTQTLKRKGVPL